MITYRPIKTNNKTQSFGDNLTCVKTGEYGAPIRPYQVMPGRFPLNCPFGATKFYQVMGMKGHNGDDWACWYKEPVYHDSEFDGWAQTGIDMEGGKGVDVVSNEPLLMCTEGCGQMHYVKRRYWHFAEQLVHDGKPIKMGDLIGLGDSTGASSGHHVHAAWKWCDKDGSSIHENNGYYGSFSCPQLTNEFVLDAIKRINEEQAAELEKQKQYEDAVKLREQIREQQLTLLQLMTKWLYLLAEQLKKLK